MKVPCIEDYPNGEVVEDITNGQIAHHCYCCGCGLSHECVIRIKRGKVYMTAERRERSTAQMRRQGNVELLNGEDDKWKMVRK